MAQPPHAHGHGHAPHAEVQSDADAQKALADAGYTNVTDLKHHGRVWIGNATNSSGASVHVVVHRKDGKINEDAGDASAAPPAPTA
jgi:hypothetical protein